MLDFCCCEVYVSSNFLCFCLGQDLAKKTTWELIQVLNQTDNIYFQAQILQDLLNREGLYYRVDGDTVEEKLEKLGHLAGTRQIWLGFHV